MTRSTGWKSGQARLDLDGNVLTGEQLADIDRHNKDIELGRIQGEPIETIDAATVIDPTGRLRLTIGTDGDPTQAWAGSGIKDARGAADALIALGPYTGFPGLHLAPGDVLPLMAGHEVRAVTITPQEDQGILAAIDGVREALTRWQADGLRVTAVAMRADRLAPMGPLSDRLLRAARAALPPDATLMCDWAGNTTRPGDLTILAIGQAAGQAATGVERILDTGPRGDHDTTRLDDGRVEATGRLYRPDRTLGRVRDAIEATVRQLTDAGHLPSDWEYRVSLESEEPLMVDVTATAPRGAWLYHADLAQVRRDAGQGQPNAMWVIAQVRDHYGQADDTHVQAFLDTLATMHALPAIAHTRLQTPTGRRVQALLERVRRAYGHSIRTEEGRVDEQLGPSIRITIKEREGTAR
ncbi:MAG: hypothetical protein UHD09_09220 [Bifidobacterium sp.]|nr:hypothetical protein [Bifidobacterium sp.]